MQNKLYNLFEDMWQSQGTSSLVAVDKVQTAAANTALVCAHN